MENKVLNFIKNNPGADAESIICYFSIEAMTIRTEISKLLISGEIEKNNSVVPLDIFRIK